ncbi:MAG: hypothetical protein U0667_15330 [Chloroflexota bacterium]
MERRVELGACRCPGAPHPSDWVDVDPVVSVHLGGAVLSVFGRAGSSETVAQALLTEAYLLYGIGAWSFVDEEGDAIPVRPSDGDWPEVVNRLLPFPDSYRVADRASEVHPAMGMVRPLLRGSSTPSQDGPTAAPTSASPASGSTPRTPSGRSSRTPTGGSPSEAPGP